MAYENGSRTSHRLVAVLLLTRSRPGPKLIFHYPPDPLSASQYNESNGFGNGSEDESDEDAISTNLSSALQSKFRKASDQSKPDASTRQKANDDPKLDDGLLGYSEDSLEKLLSPGCWSDRKKFEVCLNGLTFVGYPLHADHDGSWARKHTHAEAAAPKEEGGRAMDLPIALSNRVEESQGDAQTPSGITIAEPKMSARTVNDFTHVPESLDSHGGPSLATSMNSASTTSATNPEPLTSFHVVYVLSISRSSKYNLEISELYDHIAKPLSKALRYCQKETSYLGVESKRLQAMKLKAKDERWDRDQLATQMVESSELAWALNQVYEKISIGEVAGIRLNGTEISLQIPNKQVDETELDSNAAILLLEGKDKLLRELGHPDASPLAYFIREHTPIKSLQKHVARLGMPLDNILFLAQHLIKWRKARAIAPLNPRNVYIVGQEAPFDKLSYHIAEYSQLFSALPSLPQMLRVLSGRTIKYGMLIPSRDHREPYMDILAYLVRNRFVEQLKTSGWLQAPPTAPNKPSEHLIEPNKNKRPLSVASLLSPQLRPVNDDDNASVSSERTAIPLSIGEAIQGRDDGQPQKNNGIQRSAGDGKQDSRLVADPLNPSVEDALCLQHIKGSVDDAELSHYLPGLFHYFDGEAVFEDIAAREGLKRSKLEAWLDLLQDAGFLLTFRHL